MNWRNLLQLGSGNSCDDQELELVSAVLTFLIVQARLKLSPDANCR